MKVAPITIGELTTHRRYSGELDADAVDLASKLAGRLESVEVRIGDRVKQGQIVAAIDGSELVRQRAEASAALKAAEAGEARVRAQLGVARRELERIEPLMQKQLVSAHELDLLKARIAGHEAELATAAAQAEQHRARIGIFELSLRDTKLRAPFDAAVAARHLDPGAIVQPGQQIVRLVAAGPLRVRFRIPESDLAAASEGLPLEITTRASGDRRFTGRVTRLAGEVDRADRSVAVEGVLDEQSDLLRPGMYADIRIRSERIEQAKLAPASAVVDRSQKQGVFVVSEGVARFVPVEVLAKRGDEVAIRAGLEAGTPVVVLGHDTLKDGAKVAVEEAPPPAAASTEGEPR